MRPRRLRLSRRRRYLSGPTRLLVDATSISPFARPTFSRVPAHAPTPKPPKEDEIVAITTGLNNAGALRVFVEAKDGSVWYTWQKKGETHWEGGNAGKTVAELQPFAPAPK